jgi:hypothetical protein
MGESRRVGRRPHPAGLRNLTSLVAAYRLLALVGVDLATDDRKLDVCSWEWPWVREVWSPSRKTFLRVSVPAGALLVNREMATKNTRVSRRPITVLLVPDLGTAPVARYREMLRRLVVLLGSGLDDGTCGPESELIIATPDPDRDGRRSDAWLELLGRVARRQEQPAPFARVVLWDQVADVVGRTRVPVAIDNKPLPPGSSVVGPAPSYPWRAPRRGYEQLLHLIGRHPFLTIHHLAGLLGTSTSRIRRLQEDLVANNWLRRIELDEVPHSALAIGQDEYIGLGLVEITLAGRRQLALWLGLETAPAIRYHGLIGNGRGQAGLRRRLLRALAHTLGTNAVFVAVSMAAETAKRCGGTDQLDEWRGAAACERSRCKPDGYGCYMRDGVSHGFFLEYDRGTEPTRKYAAKFRAYYAYRDSGQAARDYRGFPAVLFVTTELSAEQRICEQAYRAWYVRGTEPLPVLVTTTNRIANDREGILGRVWRTPAPSQTSRFAERQYWLPGRPPRGLLGPGCEPVRTPRLAWPATRVMPVVRLRELHLMWTRHDHR